MGSGAIPVGMILDNYAYLNDVVTRKHEGYIYLGRNAVAMIVVSLIVIAIGAWLVVRRTPPKP